MRMLCAAGSWTGSHAVLRMFPCTMHVMMMAAPAYPLFMCDVNIPWINFKFLLE